MDAKEKYWACHGGAGATMGVAVYRPSWSAMRPRSRTRQSLAGKPADYACNRRACANGEGKREQSSKHHGCSRAATSTDKQQDVEIGEHGGLREWSFNICA